MEKIRGGVDTLPQNVEHFYPDYALYGITDTAYGFLTRGCPRGCDFCIVGEKEGRRAIKVADLSEWWQGQKNIVLMDPNILACKDHLALLEQLADSGAMVDINQGMDCRLLTDRNIEVIRRIKLKEIHFAWDKMRDEKAVREGLERYARTAKRTTYGGYGSVFVLTNYGTSIEEDLYRVYTIWEMGYYPYVMIYDKPNAPLIVKDLQRWCNNRLIFKSCPDFRDYRPNRKERKIEDGYLPEKKRPAFPLAMGQISLFQEEDEYL